jgi:hypothetical protein
VSSGNPVLGGTTITGTLDGNIDRRGVIGRGAEVRTGLGSIPSFFLPLSDSGAGAVSTAVSIGVGPATFTRATTAWTKLSSGLWASVASGTARSFYSGLDTTVGTYAGYLAEGQRTNSCLQARDLSTTWTATTATLAKDQVGIDGVTNSASSLLATAGNGQATQAITLASAAKTFSVFLKRITGTGTVQISLDNFATNTDVTASINSSTYTRVSMTQTLANPTVGVRLVTSGDKVAVDMCQLEDSASVASSPIPTTVAAVTRNKDSLTYPASGNILGTAGAVYAEVNIFGITNGNCIVEADSASGNQALFFGGGHPVSITDGTTQTDGATLTANTNAKAATRWGTGKNTCLNGTSGTAGAFDGSMNVGTNLGIGGVTVGRETFGGMKNVRIWTRELTDAQLQALTT